MSSPMRTKRLLRELRQLKKGQSENISLDATDNIDRWVVRIRGVEGTLYEGEEYMLLFEFPDEYPLESPVVTFSGDPPVHPHVYSNGHICLSILYKYWCPVLTVDAICQDEVYVQQAKSSPKETMWIFDGTS
ncbi:hypothetical protein GGH99_005843 [Coemansia sp. RSA 1285]|nr:hypothetical protein GGH99_005843 [Coemansia sp. RSA 1285]